MREKLCRMCGKWHDFEKWPRACVPERVVAQSDLPAPYFASDNIDIQSMHDGQHYTSKAKLRQSYRAAGVIEIGNEKPPKIEKPKTDRMAIRNELRRNYAERTA